MLSLVQASARYLRQVIVAIFYLSTMSAPALAYDPAPLVSDADHVQLTRLVEEFVYNVDNGTAVNIHRLFVEDGVLDTDQRAEGREAIRTWGELLDGMDLGIRHVLTNPRFVMTGPDSASGTSTLTAYLMTEDGANATVPFAVGQDIDEFVRTKDGWRFVSRRWESFFRR